MKKFKPKASKGPEAIIQQAIVDKLTLLQWFVKTSHGNMFTMGWPDLYACHRSYGSRWIEVKQPFGYKFTDAQIHDFTKMSAEGISIYVLTSADDSEIAKLFKPGNWYQYLSVYTS